MFWSTKIHDFIKDSRTPIPHLGLIGLIPYLASSTAGAVSQEQGQKNTKQIHITHIQDADVADVDGKGGVCDA